MRAATLVRTGLVAAILAGLVPVSAGAEPLPVPPAGYAYRPAAECPFASVVYMACEDQMQRLGEALTKAKADDKLLLVVIGADWCPWCRALEKLLPTDQVLARKDEIFDFPARYAFVNIATSAVVKGKKFPVPSGDAVLDLLMAQAKAARPRSIPYLVIVDPKSGTLQHRGSDDLEDPWNKAGGHDPSKIREVLRATYSQLRPTG